MTIMISFLTVSKLFTSAFLYSLGIATICSGQYLNSDDKLLLNTSHRWVKATNVISMEIGYIFVGG